VAEELQPRDRVEKPDALTVKEIVRSHWAARASKFDTGPTHGLHSGAQRHSWSALLGRWAGAGSVDALDVGCGTGFLALQLAALGHRVTGIDAADEMLALARSKAQEAHLPLALYRGDAERLPFENAGFDLLVERHVIWTLPDPSGALAEWRRVLRPRGLLVVVEGDWRCGAERGNDEYVAIQHALPLYGGRPSATLASIVRASGYEHVIVEPLMDPTLWGSPPDRERYAVLGRNPA
jgi:ubiquinone/menaquinone biosynthesis C-methylase UbiE